VEGDAFPGRPEMMALVQQQAADSPEAWAAFREAMDFGEGAALAVDAGAYAAHVVVHQEPLEPVWLQWKHRTPDTMRAISPGSLSVMRYADPEAHPDVAFQVPYAGAAWVGGLLGWEDGAFDVVLVDASGAVTRWTSTPEREAWDWIGQLSDPGDALLWELVDGGLTLNGEAFPLVPALPRPAPGFALYDGRADFVTLRE
jgi:hypothetical protein